VVWVTISSMAKLSSLSGMFYNVKCSFEFSTQGAVVGWSWLPPLFLWASPGPLPSKAPSKRSRDNTHAADLHTQEHKRGHHQSRDGLRVVSPITEVTGFKQRDPLREVHSPSKFSVSLYALPVCPAHPVGQVVRVTALAPVPIKPLTTAIEMEVVVGFYQSRMIIVAIPAPQPPRSHRDFFRV